MPIEESLRSQLDTYLAHLGHLIKRGHELYGALAADPANPSSIVATRAWQEDCGVTINQLSGGSKAHWLARSFSEAFLMRSADGRAAEAAAPAQIVMRLLEVLEKAVATLAGMENGTPTGSQVISSAPPQPHQFDFLHNHELRPVVEQAYIDSRLALEQGEYETALNTFSGILEAIVTDALERKGLSSLISSGSPAEKIADWSFETRLTVAERAGLIRGGCARLPAVARTYRDHTNAETDCASKAAVSERDARQTGQVLRVVMRDLDPGR